MRQIPLSASAGLLSIAVFATGAPALLQAALVAAIVGVATHLERRRSDAALARLQAECTRSLQLREVQLANTAHELRTPLTAVTTAVELLREGYATRAEDWHGFLDQASVAARHMAFLINDVVDFAAIENGRISVHVRDQRVQELMFDVAQVMQLTAQQRDVELRIEEPPEQLFVQADHGRFLQVVFNLVANAIKFSTPGATVHLRTSVQDRFVQFEVVDSGPGVAQEQRNRLFTRFGRVHDNAKTTVAGTGLGLHVCKLLVEHMHGTIGFRPGQTGGSVFWFRLPQAAGVRTAAERTPVVAVTAEASA